jgi:NTE family protein
MLSRVPFAGLLAVILLSASLAVSQGPTSAPKRPKIGLVLEGGGALGLAHIGVLQWLEEHHIPISYVAGTSMGGLVGGLYATGESPAEIRAQIHEIDWNEVIGGKVPFRILSYRRKEDEIEFPNSLEFGLRKAHIQFPASFTSGLQVGLLLDQISLPYSEMKSFNDLPTPFACVATDLISAKRHVFSDGSLALALRSTMSLPGIFSPVRTGDSIFVDGGLLDNLPVDVAKDMGADLVIAVQLQSRDLKPTESLSSFGVLGESLAVVVSANELRSMEKADILISVPLTDYSSMDYVKNNSIIQKGYEAAASKAVVLSVFSVDEAAWQKHIALRQSRQREIPKPQFVEVTGAAPPLAREIEHKVSSNIGKPVDSAALSSQLIDLAGDGRFARLGYRMVEKGDQQGLLIRAEKKEIGPPIVDPLIVIDGSQYQNVQFTMEARITFLDLGGFGSEWRNDLMIGSDLGVRSEFYRPIGARHRWFVAPRGFATHANIYYYRRGTLLSEYRKREAGGALDVGYSFNPITELRVGYEGANQKFSPVTGAEIFGTLQGRVGITSLRFNVIDRDSPIIPTKGYDLHFRSEWHDANPGASSEFPLSEIQMNWFKPLKNSSSVFAGVQGGTTYTHHQVGLPPFSLGGIHNLVAYGENEFLTNQYFLAKAGYLYPLLNLPPIMGDKLYAIAEIEGGKAYGIPKVSSLPMDGLGGLVVNTIFGPLLVGGSYGATGHHKVFFMLGRIF